MGLFDKKYCDVCGEKIGLLGNRKLEDGNLCKACAGQLSPFFSERKQSTVQEIKAQLAYREENKAAVEYFHVSKILGNDEYVFLDEAAGKFMVNRRKNYQDDNPDVIAISDVIGVGVESKEYKSELKRKDPDGKEVSFIPPRYEYHYSVHVTINVRHPYFSEIAFDTGSNIIVNGIGRETPDPRRSAEYAEAMQVATEIKAALESSATGAAASNGGAPKAVQCPHCGATTVPDKLGCCEYCGGAVNS